MLPTTRLGPEQRATTRTLDLALGGLQEEAIVVPLPAPEPVVDQTELASLGAPFFEVRDPIEAARVNEFRLKYRSFRKGNAKGSKGEMKDVVRQSRRPPFLAKLVDMLADPSCEEYISWTEDGKGIVLKQEDKFASLVLPRFFKHSNFTSFLRQMNMYNFLTSQQHGQWRQFSNPLFSRDDVAGTVRVKRKARPAAAPLPLAKRARRENGSTVPPLVEPQQPKQEPKQLQQQPLLQQQQHQQPAQAAAAAPLVGAAAAPPAATAGMAAASSRPRSRRSRSRQGQKPFDSISAAGLLPGSARFLAMATGPPLAVDSMRTALPGARGRTSLGVGRRRVDVRTFVSNLMNRQQVLETRLQLAEESHTALLNGYSRLTADIQDMKRLHRHYDSAVRRLLGTTGAQASMNAPQAEGVPPPAVPAPAGGIPPGIGRAQYVPAAGVPAAATVGHPRAPAATPAAAAPFLHQLQPAAATVDARAAHRYQQQLQHQQLHQQQQQQQQQQQLLLRQRQRQLQQQQAMLASGRAPTQPTVASAATSHGQPRVALSTTVAAPTPASVVAAPAPTMATNAATNLRRAATATPDNGMSPLTQALSTIATPYAEQGDPLFMQDADIFSDEVMSLFAPPES